MALEASEKRCRTILETTSEGYWRLDADTRTVEVNDAMCAMLGYEREEILGKSPMAFVVLEDRRLLTEQFDSPHAFPYRKYNMTIKKKDATFCYTRINAATIREDSDTLKGYFALVSDLTEVRDAREVLMEKCLAQAQKMESIGTLAGGIAHDFNNILFPLIGYAELLKEDLGQETAHHHYIVAILHAALRAKDLVSQILTFSRQAEGEIKPLRVYLLVNEVLKLLRSTLPTTIKIRSNLDSHCGLVAADPTQVHQVIMNLATNAFHAMETTGGSLEISLKQVSMDEDESVFLELPAGNYAQLTVTDTGTGIDKKLLDKIFDPHFTTKEKNTGTGPGLSMVREVVGQSKGGLRIYSEPGKGTTVHVYLPVVGSRDIGEPRKKQEPIQGGTESILLVDDEEDIIHMSQALLTRLGYHVTALTNSREALERFTASPEAFDLVITDMTMPGMTGIQLAENMKVVRPDIPMILCTGFSRQVNGEAARAMGIDGVVLKPLVKREMADIIRKVLGEN
ncbi:MAG: response regulator [Desulfobacteraceae bacterium]|nr:response regulator [Desulfobacteraceae bacterium]